ncbi:MAG: 5'-nucleotidase C-terminal domain-containing protein [Cyanobacteria bacterium KgW148]|nr:5'-nucleotidase C-terminal domain-containing protein [Cyanobacteria bacterium KgW148]
MPITLQILHASDLEAGIANFDDIVNFSRVVNALKDDFPNTLILSSGDNYIPGPFFSAASDSTLRSVLGREGIGRADIAVQNAIGFQAAAFGNHEFDLGPATVQSLIAVDRDYKGTQFPYLSANLDFSGDSSLRGLVVPDGQAPKPNSIAKSVVLTVGGERIGVVGATTPTLPTISSPGAGIKVTPSNFPANPSPAQLDTLAAAIQPAVDALTAQGINKVILLAHMQQFQIEFGLAQRLRDVDVIISGGSHSVFADNNDLLRPGARVASAYPTVFRSPKNEPVLVVNTGANYNYVGRLVTEFDDRGVINLASINPATSGAYGTDSASVATLTATNPGTPSPQVVATVDALRGVIVAKDRNTFGSTTTFLNGTRDDVRTQETNLGNLTADANLFAARQVDPTVTISFKNGGGIRDNIGAVDGSGGVVGGQVAKFPPPANPLANKREGQISQLDIENSLRFNNTLTLLTLTARQIQEVLEHGVADSAPGRTPGRFPQVGGVNFTFDVNRPANNRVTNITVVNEAGQVIDTIVNSGELVGNPDRTFRVVTLNFLANESTPGSGLGGDQYPFPRFVNENAQRTNRVDLVPAGATIGFNVPGTEQKAFADFSAARFSTTPFSQVDTPPDQDTRIRNLDFQRSNLIGTAGNDTLTGGNTAQLIRGLDGNDRITGGPGNDRINGNGGNDTIFGGAGADFLFGGKGDDVLNGGEGADVLSGDLGNDTLTGGPGPDIFLIASGRGTDTITDFQDQIDKLGLYLGLTFANLTIRGAGSNTEIVLTSNNEVLAVLQGVAPNLITQADFVTASSAILPG